MADTTVLPDDVLFQLRVEVQKLLVFLRADLAGGDLRPELDDTGQIVDGQRGLRQLFQLRDLGIELQVAAAQLRHAGVIVLRLFGVLREHEKLQIIIGVLFFERFEPADVLILEVHVRARLVDEVDGLIRQETVSDIALGEQDGLPRDLRGDHNAVERLIIVADAADDGNGLFNGWKVEIKQFQSDRVRQKIDEINLKNQQQVLHQKAKGKEKIFTPILISDEGLETIEWISLDCTTDEKSAPWHSDSEIKIDKVGYVIKNGTKTTEDWDACIRCDHKPLRMKIRNICGDETIFTI